MTKYIHGPTIALDVVYRLTDIDFVWDRQKARGNLRKHGVSFETSCEIFLDPFVRPLRATILDGEERGVAIGLTMGRRLLVVVYTMRAESIRIISARPATGQERTAYENE